MIKKTLTVVFCLIIAVILVACNGDNSYNEDLNTQIIETEGNTLDNTAQQSTTQETTQVITEETTKEGYEIKASDLSEEMQYYFTGNTVKNETLFIIDKGDEKSLLYPATKILSVTSYDGSVIYTEGVDYILTEDGKLQVTESSSIPCITSEVYYNHPEAMLQIEHNGDKKWVYWGEGDAMTKWQICVSYEHQSKWDGFLQDCDTEQFESIINKLQAGEDITVFFYGDSITCGANSSWYVGHNPDQYPYPMLFVNTLADLFDYTVNYIDVSDLDSLIKSTPKPYIAGERGTITYINTAVGGWTAKDGIDNFDKFVKPYIEEYGCDLFCVAFAGNDAASGHTPVTVANNYAKIIEKAQKICPELHFMMISSMVNTPLSTNGWSTPSMLDHEEQFIIASRKLSVSKNIHGAVVNMTSMSMSLLDFKEFADYSGNNINHPNDFLHRIYAQLLLQCFIGYENLD